MNALAALVQVVDFFYKAIVFYARTPEGEKELSDVARALGVDSDTTGINISETEPMSDYTTTSSGGRIVRPQS